MNQRSPTQKRTQIVYLRPDLEWFIPDTNFLFLDCGSGSDYSEGVASYYHVGGCVTTSKDDKIVPEKNKSLIKSFSNKRC